MEFRIVCWNIIKIITIQVSKIKDIGIRSRCKSHQCHKREKISRIKGCGKTGIREMLVIRYLVRE